jgi:hypothetical protein
MFCIVQEQFENTISICITSIFHSSGFHAQRHTDAELERYQRLMGEATKQRDEVARVLAQINVRRVFFS